MDRIDAAFREYHRKDFLPEHLKGKAWIDEALPIGFGQTNSQPSTVELMLGWLDVKLGDKVLDIGYGSGWTSALLSYLVGTKGEVFAVERLPELVELGRGNCLRLGIKNAHFFRADRTLGLKKYSPYDRILVSASAQQLPSELIDQLKIGGKLVIPVKEDILEITKTTEDNYELIKHYGFVFVSLVN